MTPGMGRTVVVTRPDPDGPALAARLTDLGCTPVLAPLMTVRFLPGPVPNLETIQALAFTSANGVRAFTHRLGPLTAGVLDVPVFAVGAATAAASKAVGFRNVHKAGGDVDSLAATIGDHARPDGGAIYHAAGKTVSGDLGGLLAIKGLSVVRETLYEAAAAQTLPAPFAAVLRATQSISLASRPGSAPSHTPGGAVPAVTFFSPRTARLAVDLIRKAGLETAAAAMDAVVLSEAVAKACGGLGWNTVRIARAPDTEALLACLR